MKKINFLKRMLSVVLCVVLLLSHVPLSVRAEPHLLQPSVVGTVADPGTADSWETMMGTAEDGNRYAGRVWVDKSVYQDGDTAVLNNSGEAGSTFQVDLKDDEAFQIIFSALGSTMTTRETVMTAGPMDVVLILDTSTSMGEEDGNGVTRLERTVAAANQLIDDLLTIRNVRIALVTYHITAQTVLPLGAYQNGVDLEVAAYQNDGSSDAGVIIAYDHDRKVLGKNSGYSKGSNLQSGIDRGLGILSKAEDTEGRVPVAIVLADGQANHASREGFYEFADHSDQSVTSVDGRNLYLSTLLSAAYNKSKVEAHYGKDATVYTVGVDITDDVVAKLLMNPSDATYGFNSKNSDAEVKAAFRNFLQWLEGQDVTHGDWHFDHNYPKQGGKMTDSVIASNVNYADIYFDVSNADLEQTFEQIYQELSSGAFNPISSNNSVDGGTGADDSPLIYVDFIGQYMEIKEIQAITLFGHSYGVIKNQNGTYSVTEATGTNPTTNEQWNTAKDIMISVTEQDNVQKLEIRINQQILPIIMEQAVSETVGNITSSTITELLQAPLRVYYTVGVASDILLPGGGVDVSSIQDYPYMDAKEGTVSFYSNRFGVMNKGDGGDTHVGFRPSAENRFYYHQTNQGIFMNITDRSDGSTVTIPDNNEYGILWDENKYDLTWMTYRDYLNAKDTDKVYTYVSYYRPTPVLSDAENTAEEITYLVYTDWKYLKDSVAFYDATAKAYLNEGRAIDPKQVADTIAAYRKNNPKAELYAVLGVGSLRTSRLHNMTVDKEQNTTASAPVRYAPEYTHDTATIHNGNDVVVWLGNNGKLTVKIDTGIALTKAVTEEIGNADDTYALTVKVPDGVAAKPVVVDSEGKTVSSTYRNNVLTVGVRAGQMVYVSGIPGGTVCDIGENVSGDYYISDRTEQVRIPLLSEVLKGATQFVPAVVTNSPNKYGNLFITKQITSDHAVPEKILDTEFEIIVNVGTELAGEMLTVANSERPSSLYSVTVDEAGTVVFRMKAKQTVELLRLPAGTPVTVTEVATDDHFSVSYRTRNHSGEAEDTDNALVIPAGGSATAVVMNRYTPKPACVDLNVSGTKLLECETGHDGCSFVYQVQQWDGKAWKDLPEKTAETIYAANETGSKVFEIQNVLEGITYTEVGSYSYRVIEAPGADSNVTCDRTRYPFTVMVTDHGGELVASVTERNGKVLDGIYHVTFTTTDRAAFMSIDIIKEILNLSGASNASKVGFEFKAVRTDAAWKPLKGTDASEIVAYTDAAGEAQLTAKFQTAGSYYYVLTETDQNAPGWSYSDAKYLTTIVVSDDHGVLTAAIEIEKVSSEDPQEAAMVTPDDGSKGRVSFVNTYEPASVSVDLDGIVSKELTGMTLKPAQFVFHVYQDGEYRTPVLTGTNGLNGDCGLVDFDGKLTFDAEAVYHYDVVEHIPDGAVLNAQTGAYVLNGMSYDSTVYDLVVEVTSDPATGKLTASGYFEDAVTNEVTFRNSYQATPAEYVLGGTTILHGRAPKAEEFIFELYEDGVLQQTVSNVSDGSFLFRPLIYTVAGSHTYEIREVADNIPGVSYDGAEKPVTVTVTVSDQNGVLSATANVSNGDIRFENTYTAGSAQVTFNGTKKLVGNILQDKTFAFDLYSTDRTFDTTNSSAKLLETIRNVNGQFSFKRKFSSTGTYYFVILEDNTVEPVADVVYDRTQHRFMVKVTDIGDGQLKATVTDVTTGYVDGPAASVAADVSFTNAIFREVMCKEVYLAGDADTEINGKRVNKGDILTYFITYTNYTGEDVMINVMDTIPDHTSYVEGSASHKGGFTGAHVNWILRVAKGRTITLSFDVRVDETNVVIANTAVIRDGLNTYYTNEVTNYTVQDEVAMKVFNVRTPDVDADGQTVSPDDTMLYSISYRNLSAGKTAVTIMDTVPDHADYIAGTADHGGVYQNGVITWNVDAEAGETVTVTFKVKIGKTNGATVKNAATVLVGNSTYTTNEVSNTIQSVDTPSVPKTDDTVDLRFWFALLLISCIGLAVSFGKKRRVI